MLLKKIVLISTIMTSSLALAYDPTTPSYYLTKELCAEYYADCIDVYGSAGSGGMSECGNSLNTCITTGDWNPPNLPVPSSNRLLNLFSSETREAKTIYTTV